MNAAPQPSRSTHYRFVVLAVFCSLAFLTYLDRICIMRAQGDIADDLGFANLTAEDRQRLRDEGLENNPAEVAKWGKDRATKRMGWVFSAFVAGYLLFEVPAGWLGDRWGARVLIFRIVLGWSLFTAATGGVKGLTGWWSPRAGPDEWWITLVTVRFLFGIGEAGAYPNIARALGSWFPVRERATAQSFIWFSSRLGGAFAPSILGGLMLLGGGWQRAFVVLGILGAVWAFGFYFWFRDRPEDHRRVNDAERAWIRGAGPASASVDGTIFDHSSAVRMRWASLLSFNALAICLVSFCVSFCFYFYITFLPQYLKDQFHLDFSQSQLISGLPLLVGALACLAGGFLSDYAVRATGSRRWGRSLVPILAWTAAGACAFAVPTLSSAATAMILLAVGFAFQDLGVPSMWSLPADVGGRFAGTLGGWMNTAGALGGVMSPLVASRMSVAYGWNSLFVVFGAVYLLGALAWLAVNASRPLFQSNKRLP